MFSLFKSKEKKICDIVGKCIHRQIRGALEENLLAFTESEDAVFFSGYLGAMIWGYADMIGKRGNWVLDIEYSKYICEGVLPNKLWDIYQRGQSLYDLNVSNEMTSIYNKGKDSGLIDSERSLEIANSLYLYLTNRYDEIVSY